MNIQEIEFSRANPAAYNPRVELKPGDPDWKDIEASLDEFGLVQPLIWNQKTGNLVSGHQRLAVLKHRGQTAAQMTVVDLEPPAEKKLNLAMNAVGGRWDQGRLQSLLGELKLLEIDMGNLGLRKLGELRILPVQPLPGAAGKARESLKARFGVPPFSVLDARQGYWQDRKKLWLALGIKSEIGRGENLLKFSPSVQLNGTIQQQQKVVPQTPGGGRTNDTTAYKNFGAGTPRTLGATSAKPILSHAARDAGVAGSRSAAAEVFGQQDIKDDAWLAQSTGTSIFDPVLCELAVRWFTRPGWSILEAWARLYAQTAQKPLPESLHGVPVGADELLALLYGDRTPAVISWVDLQPAVWPDYSDGKAAVLFSGGKDGVAVVSRLRREGWDVRGFHVDGLNSYSASAEREATAELAMVLKLPVLSTRIKQSGKSEWVENPLRNIFALGLATAALGPRGIQEYALGSMASHRFDPGKIDSGPSDCVEIIDAAAPIFRQSLPGYRLRHHLRSNSDSWAELIEHQPGAIPFVSSCLTPIRFRELHRKRLEGKYGVVIMQGRCGLCAKCAGEWLHLLAAGSAPENPGFEEHCLEVLHRKYEEHYKGGPADRLEALENFLDPLAMPALARWLPAKAPAADAAPAAPPA